MIKKEFLINCIQNFSKKIDSFGKIGDFPEIFLGKSGTLYTCGKHYLKTFLSCKFFDKMHFK